MERLESNTLVLSGMPLSISEALGRHSRPSVHGANVFAALDDSDDDDDEPEEEEPVCPADFTTLRVRPSATQLYHTHSPSQFTHTLADTRTTSPCCLRNPC